MSVEPALPLLTSATIPPSFCHGFTTRDGGVSVGAFASLNLGMKWGDARENVVENRRRVLLAAEGQRLALVNQVHGAGVVCVAADDPDHRAEADAVCTGSPRVTAAVFVADCVPLLIADPVSGSCAAVHAGWRGVVAGVAEATVARLGEVYGARSADLRIALGPCIGPCCFEVGPEVASVFDRLVPEEPVVLRRERAKPHVDLRRALHARLQAVGVDGDAIEASTACTFCDPQARFFSYRRDRGTTGQQLGFITRRA